MRGVFVPGWEMPESCVQCPFIDIKVANGAGGSYIACKVLQHKYDIDAVERIREKRDSGCPLEWRDLE